MAGMAGLGWFGWLWAARATWAGRRRGTYFAQSGWLINEIPLLGADESLSIEKAARVIFLADTQQALIVASPELFLPVGVLNVALVHLL